MRSLPALGHITYPMFQYIQTDPRQPWDALFAAPENTTLEIVPRPPNGWHTEIAALGSDLETSRLQRVRLIPDGAGGAPEFAANYTRATSFGDDCSFASDVGFSEYLERPEPGRIAQPGTGVRLYTAGFWTNGTLFYTNLPYVDATWRPKAGWYDWEGDDPLRVYVYGSSRSERGPQWNLGASAPPPVNGVSATNYYTTIEGFNEALKGLSTTTARIVHIPPEKAYTLPGLEKHPLYGDELVFYILLFNVKSQPCIDVLPPSYAKGFENTVCNLTP